MNTQIPKFRASYTYLSMWDGGRWQDAINAYFKLNKFVTRQMADGLSFHDEWAAHIKKTGCLPDVFGGSALGSFEIKPEVEEKVVIAIDSWLDLVVKLDCYDGASGIIHEFKSGAQESNYYAETMQPSVYAIGCVLQKKKVKNVDIHQYNQYSKDCSFSRVVVTKKLLRDGMSWINAVSKEMHEYFVKNNLYEQFK